jgi:hypothetical protein
MVIDSKSKFSTQISQETGTIQAQFHVSDMLMRLVGLLVFNV